MTDAKTLPSHVDAEVQRILDRSARRLLAALLDGDPAVTAAWRDGRLRGDGVDQGAQAFVEERRP